MDTTTGFLIYAGVFRLAIIATGALAVYLGYKLFARGVMPEGTTEAGVEAGEVKLTVKNAAPGTCFALFGAALIAAMIFQGSPELVINDVERVDSLSGKTSRDRSTTLKGAPTGSIEAWERFRLSYQEAQTHSLRGDDAAALAAYGDALSQSSVSLEQAAHALNGIAWLYAKQDRTDEALSLARIAVTVDKQEPAFLDTLANVLIKRGELDEALVYAQSAVEMRPTVAEYLHTLAQVHIARGERSEGRMRLEQAAELDARYQAELEQLDSASQ